MRSTPARRVAFRCAVICAILLLLGLLFIPLRYLGATAGIIPTMRVSAEGATLPATAAPGEAIRVEYCSEAVTASDPTNLSGRTATNLAFNDAWLFRDASAYHHDLATACAVLAAICNSESQYYSNVDGAIPYAEQALWALGFDDVRTESYALRSTILDELGALVVGSHDVAAYVFASKTVPDPRTGDPVTLVFVGVRGSYGIEWISNFNLHDEQGASGDHHGFGTAEGEIERALSRYVREIKADPQRTRILITGHSRGGSIANLLAARLGGLEGTPDQIAPASGIYAYTFAAPGSTRERGRHAAAYDNIFNIVNEADIVIQFPFSTWGYGSYGTTVFLPNASSEGFEKMFGHMREAFARNTGITPAYDRAGLYSVADFAVEANKTLSSREALPSPERIAGAGKALLGMDVSAALSSHFPDTYIAWMQSVDGTKLSFHEPDTGGIVAP